MRFPTTYSAPPGISDGARRIARAKLAADLPPCLVTSVKEVLIARRAKSPDDTLSDENGEVRVARAQSDGPANLVEDGGASLQQGFATIR